MTPEDLKALRTELKCTAKELAGALALDQATVMKWESGELFPTKKYVDAMEALREKGPSAIPRKAKGAQPSPMRVLADPALWELVRKLVAHKKLRDEALKLAATYADPAEELRLPPTTPRDRGRPRSRAGRARTLRPRRGATRCAGGG